MWKGIIRNILIILFSLILSLGGAAMFAAFEAHIVNVTAKIENALAFNVEGPNVRDGAIDFGTVFPQEYFNLDRVNVSLSSSFLQQNRITLVDYKIEQKPKCVDSSGHIMPVTVVGYTTENKPIIACPADHNMMPLLCPYISKTEITQEETNENDFSAPPFHRVAIEQVANGFTVTNDPLARGQLIKEVDNQDSWLIDLAVPCFGGKCSEDWPSFVQSHNPNANPSDFELDPSLESKQFGCDLWFEVTGISPQT